MYIYIYIYIHIHRYIHMYMCSHSRPRAHMAYGQFSKVQSGKMGTAPGRFELQRAFMSGDKQGFWDLRPSI